MSKSKILVIVASLFIIGAGCAPTPNYHAIQGYAQGGKYQIKYSGPSPENLKRGVDSILTLIDTTLSGYNPASQLSRFNRGEAIFPNEMFLGIYARAHAIWVESEGAFDIAAGPLFNAWGFGFTHDSLPGAAEVEKLLANSGMWRLKADMRSCLRPDGSLHPEDLLSDPHSDALPILNYNAIAQGWSCDVVAEYLHSKGVENMLVDIGEIYCEGLNPSGQDWTIGVDTPFDGNDRPGESISGIWKSGGAATGLVTSGNYRKFYEVEGVKYSHTIDPRSGYPVTHKLLSATVAAPDAATADAVATWCMVIGTDAAKVLIESRKDLEAYLIFDTPDGMDSWSSSGMNMK